jgi:hypothetical protein
VKRALMLVVVAASAGQQHADDHQHQSSFHDRNDCAPAAADPGVILLNPEWMTRD